jgi:type II secretory pathway component GspD/PulD (secretin)
MARKYIGGTLSGGVMVLCMVLFLAPQTHSQITMKVKTFHISGNAGESGVVLMGLPGTPTPVTDSTGSYDVEVRYGWNGTVSPTKPGYTFNPKQRSYPKVTEDLTAQDYEATIQQFVIAGSVGEPNVVLRGLPGDPTSDAGGRYSVAVDYGWSGTVTPYKEGKRFEPDSKSYDLIAQDKRNENYTPQVMTFTISGSAGTSGVTLKGFPEPAPVSGADFTYHADVPYGWSGTVTPTKEGCEFSPPQIQYPAVKDNQAYQDYIATVHMFTISGSTGMAGVTLEGLPGEPITGEDGFYSVEVEYGWSGKVTPSRLGYTFNPPGMEYTKVTENKESQNYTGKKMMYTIQGTAGVPGAEMTGLPGDVISGPSGLYTVTVEYGWSGTITPKKEGYVFDPSFLIIDPISKDMPKQDFKAKQQTFTISGIVGQPGVWMQGLPGRVVSGQDGTYTAEVPYKAHVTVLPRKEGFSFEPDKQEYDSVTEPQLGQDYTATKKQYTISGRVTVNEGSPEGVMITTDPAGVEPTTTDANGVFELTVEHGWQGKLTPIKQGFSFSPPSVSVPPVTASISTARFAAKVQMMTITDRITVQVGEGKPPEGVAGVTVTANPGGNRAITDDKGRYTIRVPFGWSGELVLAKEGYDIEPSSVVYSAVTENIDKSVAAQPGTTTPPTGTEPTATTPAGPTTPGLTPATGQQPGAPMDAAALQRAELQRQIDMLKAKMNLPTEPNNLAAATGGPTPQPGPPSVIEGPVVTGEFSGDLISVLTAVSQRTGAKIYVDLTVKSTTIQPVTLISTPMNSALDRILTGTGYTFRKEPNAENTYQVFRPITQTFSGDELRRALQDLSTTAGVPIIPDETVTGQVYAEFTGVPLESALEMLVSGTPYVVKRMPDDFYLVADRKVESSAFPQICETRQVRLNYITPGVAKSHLSDAFTKYVLVDLDPNSRLVTVTAPTELADRLVQELHSMDMRPKHVLLDARIVTMERGDLLNIGVDWGMPTAQFGMFSDSWVRGTPATDEAVPSGTWPWAISLGLTFDRTFTNSLTAALNLLKEKNQADIISKPKIVAQDGHKSRIAVMTEENYVLTPQIANQGLYYMQAEFQKITSGTSLEITPHIGDNNDIMLELAVEVSDSIPKGRGNDLPVVTRRTAQHTVTVKDGGTALLAGLTENRSKDSDQSVPGLSEIPLLGNLFKHKTTDKATREVAVFVTATIIPETNVVAGGSSSSGAGFGTGLEAAFGPQGRIASPADDAFRRELQDNLAQ